VQPTHQQDILLNPSPHSTASRTPSTLTDQLSSFRFRLCKPHPLKLLACASNCTSSAPNPGRQEEHPRKTIPIETISTHVLLDLLPPTIMDTNMEDVKMPLTEPMQMSSIPLSEPASIPTLDGWIESLMNCKQLAESDVQRLCDKVVMPV